MASPPVVGRIVVALATHLQSRKQIVRSRADWNRQANKFSRLVRGNIIVPRGHFTTKAPNSFWTSADLCMYAISRSIEKATATGPRNLPME